MKRKPPWAGKRKTKWTERERKNWTVKKNLPVQRTPPAGHSRVMSQRNTSLNLNARPYTHKRTEDGFRKKTSLSRSLAGEKKPDGEKKKPPCPEA